MPGARIQVNRQVKVSVCVFSFRSIRFATFCLCTLYRVGQQNVPEILFFFYLRSAGSYKSDILPESSTNEYYLTVKYRKIYSSQFRDKIDFVDFEERYVLLLLDHDFIKKIILCIFEIFLQYFPRRIHT